MDTQVIIVFAIILLAIVFFVWGKIRSDIVALLVLLSLVLTGILTPAEGLSGFSNSVVVMMVCLFIVGGAIFQTGLAKMIAASMCFASPFATPPNALVMSAGRYKFMDYVRVGLPLQLVIGVVMIFVLPMLFPF